MSNIPEKNGEEGGRGEAEKDKESGEAGRIRGMREARGGDDSAACSGQEYEPFELAPPSPAGDELSCEEFEWEEEEERAGIERMASSIKVRMEI